MDVEVRCYAKFCGRPERFIKYTDDEDATCKLVEYDLAYHLFAEVMQEMLHCPPAAVPRMMSTLNDCFVQASGWCVTKRLHLEANKTHLLLLKPLPASRKFPLTLCRPSVIESANVVQDLVVMLDAQLMIHDDVSWIA